MTSLLAELFAPGRFELAPGAAFAAAVVAAAALLVLARRRRAPRALAWPALAEARAAGARRGDPLGLAAAALRGLALVALALALAGPTRLGEQPPETRPGLDLVLVLDASASMRALDAEVAGAWRPRVELAREVVARFAEARASAGDRVALVAFGDTAFTLCPLSTDGALLAAALARVEAGMAGNATALGDALALAVKRAAGGSRAGEGALVEGPTAAPREGRLVVLLTDGRANAGAVPVEVAAALARANATRVHAVGIGTRGEVAMASPTGGRELRLARHDLDEETLRAVADATGGRYFAARSSADLAAVYGEIDALERTEREAPPRPAGEPRPEPFLAAACLALALELGVARGLARRVP
ncbi:MAG TPA: VWA domain-containing protein [Myxococcota bacterium]|nr:VWA domain-containing protein [Myxococcota bacterium]